MMPNLKRPLALWVIVVFMTLFSIMVLLGQTTAIFAYDLTVSMGLQESIDEVGPFGVEMNRSFGIGDTVAYIPLMILSVIGLLMRKRWALFTTAAVMRISVYWAVTMGALLMLAPGVPGYTLEPGIEYTVFLGAHIVFGILGLIYLLVRRDRLFG
jgi:hypothetical protein